MVRLPLIATLGVMLPTIAGAQSLDGAYISLERLSFSSEDFSYTDGTDFYGSSIASIGGEVGFGAGFAGSADLTNYGGDLRDTSATLHALYRIGNGTAIGAFYGFDWLTDQADVPFVGPTSFDLSGNFYGAEARTSFAGTSIEGFVSQAEGDIVEGTMYGLAGEYMIGSYGLIADYSAFDGDGYINAVDRFSVGGVWNYTEGVAVYTELGRINYDLSSADPAFAFSDGSENFIAVGIRIGFGPNSGNTFGPRSYREIFF